MADADVVVGGFNQSQLDILQQGTDLYRSAAMQELSMLLGGLGLEAETVTIAVTAAGSGLASASLLDAKDVAERLQFVRRALVGQATASLTIDCTVADVSPLLHSATTDSSAPGTEDGESVQKTQPADADVIHSSVEPTNDVTNDTDGSSATPEVVKYIDPKTAERLAFIYGFKCTGADRLQMLPPQFFTVEKAKIADAITALVDFLIKNKHMWSTRREHYIELLQRRIIDGIEYKQFGDQAQAAQLVFSRSKISMSNIPEEARLSLLSPFTSIPSGEITRESQHLQRRTAELAEEEAKIRTRQVLEKLYGSYLPEIPDDADFGFYDSLVSAIFELVQTHADKRLVNNITTHRQIIDSLTKSNLSLTDVSKELGKSDSYASAMFSTLANTTRRLLLIHGVPKIGLEPTPAADDQKQPDATEQTATNNVDTKVADDVTAEIPAIQEADDGITKLRKLFNLDEADEQVFRDMFNPERSQPIRSESAATIYADLRVVLDAVIDSKKYSWFERSLEYKALRLLTNGAKNGDPLAPKTVQSLLSGDLKHTRQKIADVFSNAFTKLARIRLEMLQQK